MHQVCKDPPAGGPAYSHILFSFELLRAWRQGWCQGSPAAVVAAGEQNSTASAAVCQWPEPSTRVAGGPTAPPELDARPCRYETYVMTTTYGADAVTKALVCKSVQVALPNNGTDTQAVCKLLSVEDTIKLNGSQAGVVVGITIGSIAVRGRGAAPAPSFPLSCHTAPLFLAPYLPPLRAYHRPFLG